MTAADHRIAVVGLACRFPGAPDADAYWELLRDGREGLTRFTDDELAARGVPGRLRAHPGFVPVGGLIEGQADFDPEPFGFTDAEAALLDPQHRLFLECAWHALEHAGHGGGRAAGAVGVFAGAMQSAYLASNLAGRWNPTGAGRDPLGSLQTAISTQADYLPLQTAYRLNLTGPAVAVASSCSTSLVAVHLAAQSLLSGECDTALAGGVSLIVPQGQGYVHVAGGVYAADGTVRPFSADGTGIVYTQGAGVVVLRRLDDALADGDPVLAVLHGSAVNNDGADKAGFTAPSPRGQARAVAEALTVAGAAPHEIGLIEAHGTATALGDPIEVAALRRVFGDTGPAWCGLGSVKGNIGHANSAAGIASFIKAVLAVRHRVLPASLHAHPLNPLLGLEGSPFEVVTETRDWDTPPLAGVSSFGIGGTNCHAVLGPAPQRPPAPADRRPQVLAVSAATPEAALATARAVASAPEPDEADLAFGPEPDEADLAYTLATGRAELAYRVAGVGRAGLAAATPVKAAAPRLVFAFPGAGSAHPGMGGELYRDEPVFAQAVDECAELLRPLLGADVRDAMDPEIAGSRLRDAAFGLPAVFAVSYGVARLLASWGVVPDALVGHSLGECTAAAVSGALPLPEAARLVAARCAAAARAAGGGAMLALPLGEDEVRELLSHHPDLDVAAVNAPAACVVSGPARAIDRLAEELGGTGTRLRVDAAMHSRLMDPELPGLGAALAGLTGGAPTVPVFSTVTGAPIGAELAGARHWTRQLREPVRFAQALRAAVEDETLVLEAGPGSALSTLARRNALPGLRAVVTTLLPGEPEAASLRQAAGTLWAHGRPVDLAALPAAGRRRVHAPGYAFQRRRLWIDPPAAGTSSEIDADEPLQVPVWSQILPTGPAALPAGRWAVIGAGALAAELRDRLDAADSTDPLAGLIAVTADDPEAGDPDTIAAAVLAFGEVAAAVPAFGGEVAAAAAEQPGQPCLLLITRHGEQVGGDPAPDPAQAALRVLPRVLGQEQPGLRWATLDLGAPADPATEAQAVLRELGALASGEGTGTEIALRGATRWRRRLSPWTPPATGEDAGPPGTVLITGGLGAVGQLFARHLAARGHRVVVTSRTAHRQGAETGADVRVCDATDPAATAALIKELSADGPIELVVHAAGVVAGARLDPLRSLDAGQAAEHVRAKAGGALALRDAIAALPAQRRPRTVLLMSSVTTLVGGVGMGPYAAANAAMDALGRAAPGPTRWVSAVWDGWRVAGNGTEATVVLKDALDAATGTKALDRLLAARESGTLPPVVSVAATDLNPRVAEAGRPRTIAAPSGDVTRLSPAERVVAELWSELFGAPVTDPGADFFALGGHSLLGVRMLAALGERFGVRPGMRDLLSAPTVAGVARLVESADTRPDQGVTPAEGVLDGDGTFAMTRVQHAYWIGRDGGYQWGDLPCHFYLEYDCHGLDLARFEEAWNQVVNRHPMLRAVATPEGRLRVLEDLPRYRIRVHDLTDMTPERRARRLAVLRERLSTRPGPPDRWPLAQIQAARLPGDVIRLFIGVDVLVCDAASWWIIESELHALYTEPNHPLPPLDLHPAACAAALERTGDERAARYWRERLDTLPGPPRLPVRDPDGKPPRFVRRSARLGDAEWAAFRAAAARHRVTPAAALLTVYADVLARWSGSAGFCVTLTLFDRPAIHPHVNRVVGDFTSLLLHEVPAEPAPTFAGRAAATQARMFDDLDHRGFSALDVLAEQAARTGEVRPVPVVFTSALGITDMLDGGGRLEWAGEQVYALSQTPQTWLDHQVLEHDGELRLQWDALDGVLPGDELEAAIAAHVARVRELAASPAAWTRGEPGHAAPPPDRAAPSPGDLPPPSRPEPAPRAAAAQASPARDIVLPLRAEPGGAARPTLYLAHPSGGDVLCYAELSRLLDRRVDVVALADPELAGAYGPGPETVEGIAEQYVRAIDASGGPGEGPWLLGGWSMGGTVAQEMARQLHARGRRTALLALLDSNDPALIREVPGRDAAELAWQVTVRHLHALEAYLGIDLSIGEVPPDRRMAAVADRLREHRLLGRGEDLAGRVAVFARHLRALAAHTPRRLADPDTVTLLIRAERPSPRNSGIGMGVDDTPPGRPDLGWGRYLAGPVEAAGVDAHHYGLLHAPVLPAVARLINAALDRALARLRER
ncbi:SDR family NAD(P)-dependent oxidoreductase [Nonomuraea sp. FMUSA5-5]|uniref:SDR family NAD(P)-dependent oxidoreductase n=1 Tax=Nonomuraea composti TaxID=2720023 RepID=A0ABX1B8J9_9ACTN|nr:type I polyketide synthase [Nonomuraea sp. FMUSA5-5]NJP92624.1 SDR family NAD(P)-dependent oxidoreductase [Nonomuraea sp. FMUSA5-5]